MAISPYRQGEFSDSRAVLIGVSAYRDSAYPAIPAAANSLAGMLEVLTDPDLGRWPHERVTVISNPRHAGRLAQELRRVAQQTTGALLLYFVGHGAVTESGELCLTLADTDADDPDLTGLEYSKVRSLFLRSPAAVKVSILDCCYSGRAIEALAPAAAQLADLSDIRGVYTLTAADTIAHVVPFAKQFTACTSFTGELLDLTRTGIPGYPPQLTLADIYPRLRHRLVSRGLPSPNQRGTDTADRYVFTRNAANDPPGQSSLPFSATDTRPVPAALSQPPSYADPQLSATVQPTADAPLVPPHQPPARGRKHRTPLIMRTRHVAVSTGNLTRQQAIVLVAVMRRAPRYLHTAFNRLAHKWHSSRPSTRTASFMTAATTMIAAAIVNILITGDQGAASLRTTTPPTQPPTSSSSSTIITPCPVSTATFASTSSYPVTGPSLSRPPHVIPVTSPPTRPPQPNSVNVTALQVNLLGGSPTVHQIALILNVKTAGTGHVTVTVSYCGAANRRIFDERTASWTLSGETSYSIGASIPTDTYCGDVFFLEAASGDATDTQATNPGC